MKRVTGEVVFAIHWYIFLTLTAKAPSGVNAMPAGRPYIRRAETGTECQKTGTTQVLGPAVSVSGSENMQRKYACHPY